MKLEDENNRLENEKKRALEKEKRMMEYFLDQEDIEDQKSDLMVQKEKRKKMYEIQEKKDNLEMKEMEFQHQQKINDAKLQAAKNKLERNAFMTPPPYFGIIYYLSWWDTSDNLGGLRCCTHDSRVYFAVSKSSTWDRTNLYEIPPGYRWLSTSEGTTIFNGSNRNGYHYTYHGQGGWNGYVWGGETKYYFRFSDSHVTDSYKHAGNPDYHAVQYSASTSNFAGLVLIRI